MLYLLSHLRHRPRRAIVVVTGVALGSALFIALTALGDGFRGAASAPLAEIATDLEVTRPDTGSGAVPEDGNRGVRAPDGMGGFTAEEVAAVGELDEVAGVAGSVMFWDFGARQTVTVVGADPAADRLGPGLVLAENVVSGRAFEPGERGVATVDMHYAEFYGLTVGSGVDLGGTEVEIVGVTQVTEGSQAAAANLFVPVEDARELVGLADGEVNQLHVALSDAGETDAVVSQLNDRLGEVSAITEDSMVQVFGAIGQISARFSAIAASVGLFGGAVLSWAAVQGLVRERTREIGLLQATGWRRRNITRVFTSEAAVLSTAGGMLGVALGLGAAALLGRLPMPSTVSEGVEGGHGGSAEHVADLAPATLPIAVDPLSALLAVGVAVGAGVLAGWVASRRATGIDPVRNLASV